MAGDRGGKARHTASLQIILAGAGAGTNFREKSEPRGSLGVFHASGSFLNISHRIECFGRPLAQTDLPTLKSPIMPAKPRPLTG